MIESRLQVSLLDAERRCQRTASELREDLIELAKIGRAQSARDYSVEVESVKERLPGLFINRDGAKSTPYEALISCGILLETSGPESKQIVGFRIADAGSYLLSFALESSAAENDDTFSEVAAEWLNEAWNYSPLLDALLAWVDRLSDRPRSPRLLLLLESILHSHRGESLFGLMQPAVLGSLFEMLKRGDENEVWGVRDAAVEVRPSPTIWPVVGRHLRDLKPEARRLAVELVALHRHEEFIPDLVELLGDEDEYVRQEVFVSFGRLGKPSIPFLLRALEDQARPTDLRERYLWALANVGYRDSLVSEWIGRCLEGVADDGLLQSALLLAAHLRDRSQKGHAITALAHENYRVVQAAVKYLKEAPAPEAFDALREKLRPQRTEGGDIIKRHSLPRQLMTAILETDPAAGAVVVLGVIRDGIGGVGELNAVNAAEAAERYGIAAAYPLILERTVADLTNLSERNILRWTSEILGKAWKWEELESLAAAAPKLKSDGIDIARLFVNAIASSLPEHEEFPMGDRLNRVKDLHAVIKARAENFVPEACRLLPTAPDLSSAELCRFFWLAADARAEEALLAKLGTPLNENGREWYAQNLVVSALSTCGARRGGQAVLSYTRSGQRISYYFHQEALHPLLVRGIVRPDELVGIIDDRTCIGRRS